MTMSAWLMIFTNFLNVFSILADFMFSENIKRINGYAKCW
jgi:hypothetical protein